MLQPEEKFYQKLFTKSDKWSKTTPNKEEQTRWAILKNFVHFVKGYYAAAGRTEINILDLGCGRGWLSNLLSEYGSITGIEPIKPVVEHANKIFPNLNIMHGTSDTLIAQHMHGKFDLIVSSEVIEHVPDDEKPKFVANIKELLNDKGFAIITTPRKEIEEEFKKYSKPNQPVEDWISEKDLKKLFIDANFKNHFVNRFAIRPINRYHPFAPSMVVYQLWLFQKN